MALPTMLSNQPSAGFISWTGFGLQYDGIGFEVLAGSTNKKFVWWDYNGGGGNLVANPLQEGAVNLLGSTTASAEVPPVGTARRCAARDHLGGGTIPVAPTETYRVMVTALRTAGTRALRGGISYTAQTAGSSWDSLADFTLVENLAGGWGRYMRTLTVPAGKSAAAFYIQIHQDGTTGYDTVWHVADLRIENVATSPSVLMADTLPDLAPEDCLLFLNRNGVGVLAPTAQVVDGSIIVSGSIIGDAIAANQIDATHIKANAITATHLAADSVTAGAIAAGAITTDNLTVAAVTDNLVANGSFEDGVQGWEIRASGAGGNADIVTGVASSGAYALRLVRGTAANLDVGQTADKFIPVTSNASRRYYVACSAGASATLSSGFYLRIYWWQANKTTAASTAFTEIAGNRPLSTTWATFEGQAVPPANARYAQVVVINAASGSTMYVDEITVNEVIVSAQIGDGQITSPKIVANAVTATHIAAEAVEAVHVKAGSISVDKVEPAFGEQLILEANASVQIIVNTQSQTRAELDRAKEDLAGVSGTAQVAADAAAAAQAAADVANGNIAAVDGRLGDTQAQLASIQTWFWVDGEGAHVGRSDSPFQTHVLADRFQITQNGLVQGYFAAGGLVTPKVDTDVLFVSNHKIEPFGTGTIIRKV